MPIALFRLSIFLAATRLIAITMPMADVILLTHFSPDHLPSYALGAQWAQIGVVACGALGVGIAIAVPRCLPTRRATWLPTVLSNAVSWGVCIALMTGVLALVPTSLSNSGYVTAILAVGMVPLSIYASLASFNQCVGRSRLVLGWTLLAGVVNFALDVVFINTTEPARGVAWATTLCWIGLCMVTLYQALKKEGTKTIEPFLNLKAREWPRRPWKAISGTKRRALTRIALPDFLSKIGFVGAMALGFWWLSATLTSGDIKTLAAILNYMNFVFVVVASVVTAFGISFLGTGASFDRRRYAACAAAALLILQAILFCLSPLASYVYFGTTNTYFLWAVNVATIVVFFDGIALFAITLLRMLGVATAPPYLRLLMFPCAAGYISISQSITFLDTIEAMLFGNFIVALCLCGLCAIVVRRSVSLPGGRVDAGK